MIKLRRITRREDKDLQALMSLYEEAFPVEERRREEQLFRLVENEKAMFFNAVELEGEIVGLFVYWKFDDFYYLEHLAVYARLRNKKIGQQVLDYAREHLDGDRVLEVEHPLNEIAERRIAYYRRNGYEVVEKKYVQPSYDGVTRGIPLWIMSNNRDMNPAEAIDTIKEEVYRKNY